MKKLEAVLAAELEKLKEEGRLKGKEEIIVDVKKGEGAKGPRYFLKGRGEKEFIRMNSNSYLGLSLRDDMMAAEEEGARKFGVGPGAVRFISGTFAPHRELEHRLAAFHGREDAMIFSAAYVTVGGVITSLISKDTYVISDELNHNSIINAIKLGKPPFRSVYAHNSLEDLKRCLDEAAASTAKRVLVVTDGVFSMRGDYAPLKELVELVHSYDDRFAEDAFVVVDDSHGVGAYGATGRGTEEVTGARVDILIGTLGKAYGVNGGYVVGSRTLITYLREHAAMYIYSNPISAGEACAVIKALDILQSDEGVKILEHMSLMTERFEKGIVSLGYETIPGPHPVTPLVLRDTARTQALVAHLLDNGVLATGLAHPVVPKGAEEIRFQINGDHTEADIDEVLAAIASFKG
ncbi:MAG: aminotransferase class I/II-fold pyridoxal phosphate-dependent enzyme [Pyramidobacter sp.]|nr:aminotransferase class I/II-fold pyridoxal phosphate-dependent enzyme [Pyramidobacter sp.]